MHVKKSLIVGFFMISPLEDRMNSTTKTIWKRSESVNFKFNGSKIIYRGSLLLASYSF